jgi:F0F1-type ATP synthase assembly protein I
MKINDLKDFFEKQKEITKRESEKKMYSGIALIISELKCKNLSKQQWESIENQIETLQLTQIARKRNRGLKKKRNQLLNFLKNNFSFIPEKYYTGLGMSLGYPLGAAVGMTFGIIIDVPTGMIYGMILGALIGLIAGILIGKMKDNQAEKENRVIKI